MIAAVKRLFSSVFVGVLALCKRAMCFLNRKRRDSGTILPTHIQDVNHDIPTQVLSNNFELPAQIDPTPPSVSKVNLHPHLNVGDSYFTSSLFLQV